MTLTSPLTLWYIPSPTYHTPTAYTSPSPQHRTPWRHNLLTPRVCRFDTRSRERRGHWGRSHVACWSWGTTRRRWRCWRSRRQAPDICGREQECDFWGRLNWQRAEVLVNMRAFCEFYETMICNRVSHFAGVERYGAWGGKNSKFSKSEKYFPHH